MELNACTNTNWMNYSQKLKSQIRIGNGKTLRKSLRGQMLGGDSESEKCPTKKRGDNRSTRRERMEGLR